MNQKRLLIAAGIIALIIIVSFMTSVPYTRDILLEPITQKEVASVPTVTLQDVFKKGTHTITGSVEAPNACAMLTATASLIGDASTTGNIVQVALVMPTNTGVCLQLSTRIPFSTTITAPAQIQITATVNGIVASTSPS